MGETYGCIAMSKSPATPLAFLHRSNGSLVRVRLKSGAEFSGRLEICDDHMNLVLEDVKEWDVKTGSAIRRYGKIFIRGNNVLFIMLNPEE